MMKKAGWKTAALLTLVASCGGMPDDPATPGVRSGSRLRARWEEIGPGARRFAGWFDRDLNVPCRFEEYFGPNRAHRCVPEGPEIQPFWFADAACTRPLARSSACDDPPSFAFMPPTNACLAGTRVFRVDPRVSTTTVFVRDGSTCRPARGGDTFGWRFNLLGEEVPPEALVAAVEEPAPTGGRIRSLWLAGEDGSRTPWGAWDAARRVAVARYTAEDGQLRWLPAYVSFVLPGLFADAACTLGVSTKIARNARCPLDAALEFRFENIACEHMRLRHVVHASAGPASPEAPFARSAQGVCGPRRPGDPAPNPADLLLAVGPHVAHSAFEVARVMDFGSGDGRVRRAVGSDGAPIVASAGPVSFGGVGDVFLDARRGEECVPELVEGRRRCVPFGSAIRVDVGFADAACTRPVALFTHPPGCARGAVPSAVVFEGERPTPACESPPRRAVREAVPLAPSARWYVREEGRCVERQVPTQGDVEMRRLSDPLRAADFLPVQELTE